MPGYPVMRRDHIFDPVRHNGYSIGDLRRFTRDDEKKMTRRELLNKLGVAEPRERGVYSEDDIDWSNLVALCRTYWITGTHRMTEAEIRQEVAFWHSNM